MESGEEVMTTSPWTFARQNSGPLGLQPSQQSLHQAQLQANQLSQMMQQNGGPNTMVSQPSALAIYVGTEIMTPSVMTEHGSA